jgi:hypothetical protein
LEVLGPELVEMVFARLRLPVEALSAQLEPLEREVFAQLKLLTEAILARPKALLETPSDGLQFCDVMLEGFVGATRAFYFGLFVEG